MKTASLNTVLGFVRRIAVRDAFALSDRELLDRFIERRDDAAFAELVRRHGAMVLAACRRVLRHEQDAEDAFQAAFLVLARRAHSIRSAETLGGWLHQVAYRLALRAGQLSARRRERAMPAGDALPATNFGDSMALDDELARLPEPYRAVVILCYLEGHTQGEAARILATTTDAVNSRLKRARDLLRARFARHGSALAVLAAAGAAQALPADAIGHTARVAQAFAANSAAPCGASALAIELAKGALSMIGATLKALAALTCLAAIFVAGVLYATPGNPDDRPTRQASLAAVQAKDQPKSTDKKEPRRACIILWMSGGPSQIDTFDPKPGAVSLFPAIDTSVKGMQFNKHLPLLAKQAKHLAVIRSLKHPEGDHARASRLMRTGFAVEAAGQRPVLGSVLAKELDAKPGLPRYVRIWEDYHKEKAEGFLPPEFGPLIVPGRIGFGADPGKPTMPGAKQFDAIAPKDVDAMRKAFAKAFDLDAENAQTRAAYGANSFGQGCLLARRLVEAGTPVVEVVMGGWDTHVDALTAMPKRCAQLDAGMASLVNDLAKSGRLDHTLIVWMGEFGRTPRVNGAGGRDHWPRGFSALLAGSSIKGGQAIGKTSDDGFDIKERAVSPAELHATIYQALGVDVTKTYRAPNGDDVPLVPKDTKAVKEALR